jgi:hypothetical protein
MQYSVRVGVWYGSISYKVAEFIEDSLTNVFSLADDNQVVTLGNL